MLIRVAVPVPRLDLLIYRVPDDVDTPVAGARVIVPLGSRLVTGIVVDMMGEADRGLPASEIKTIGRVLDEEAFIPSDIVALASWTGEYYAAGVGETITAVLPPKTRGSRADAHKTRRVATITDAGLQALRTVGPSFSSGDRPSDFSSGDRPSDFSSGDRPSDFSSGDRPSDFSSGDRLSDFSSSDQPTDGRPNSRGDSKALRLLAGNPNGLPTPTLTAQGVASRTIARLAARGLITLRHDRLERDPFETELLASGEADHRVLTSEQRTALSRLLALLETGGFRVALLHGVTGSGKTEIYLRLSLAVRAAGKHVLVLVPEIALTPAIAATFRGAFGNRVAIQHSGLSDGERHDQWKRIRRNEIDVVVGTRSAVFAPLERVGLIIIDEEHDAAYKQEESPRYNARDVAIVRAQKADVLVLLGSATPSIESYHNAATGKYEHLTLEERILARPLPSVTVVNMRHEYAAEGPDVVLSRSLRTQIEARLAGGEQSLILLNRRGFATTVFCRQCGGTVDCPNCSVSLVVHGAGTARRARCHYCDFSTRVPAACAGCAAPYLEQTGFGTQRVEAEVIRYFPGARVARLDRDAVRRKGSLASVLSRFRAGDIDVLIGTQMIAKGHDFPRVTLVGVVSADVGLGIADFRASERTFQLLTQVTGRAGRGEQPGEAIIQTLYPEHYSIQLACRQDYRAFYKAELKFREAMRYPPCISLINVIVHARSMAAAMQDARHIAASLGRLDSARDSLRVLGPAPAPLARLRKEYRAQMLIKGANRGYMRKAVLKAIAEHPRVARRTTVDVDPISVL